MSQVLSDRFKSLLQAKGYTYRDLGRMTGIPETTIRAIAIGQNKKKDHLKILAKVLSVDYEYLVSENLLSNNHKVDLMVYGKIYTAVVEELTKYSIECTKTLPDTLRDLCYYLHTCENKDLKYNDVMKGIIVWGLHTGSLVRIPKEEHETKGENATKKPEA